MIVNLLHDCKYLIPRKVSNFSRHIKTKVVVADICRRILAGKTSSLINLFMLYICCNFTNKLIAPWKQQYRKKATMFRLPTDLLDRLKEMAKREHRSLNNFVECILLDIAYNEPNKETMAAIAEARSGKLRNTPAVDTSSEEAMFKSVGKKWLCRMYGMPYTGWFSPDMGWPWNGWNRPCTPRFTFRVIRQREETIVKMPAAVADYVRRHSKKLAKWPTFWSRHLEGWIKGFPLHSQKLANCPTFSDLFPRRNSTVFSILYWLFSAAGRVGISRRHYATMSSLLKVSWFECRDIIFDPDINFVVFFT